MINNKLLFTYDYCLKWKDIIVLKFNVDRANMVMINAEYLPMSIADLPVSYDMVTKFCCDRVLMYNRKYCKEVLTSCGIDDPSPVNICLVSMALSFMDNYWICRVKDSRNWKDVNLYENKFSNKIAMASLTGKSDVIELGDGVYTGELTVKGTRAKCFYRKDGGLYLYKIEDASEINSEMLSYYVARAIGVASSKYFYDVLFGKGCSVCQILTDEHYELIPYRDIVSRYGDKVAYEYVFSVDPLNFMLMQIFDYITLNTDRNRDNFGLLRKDGYLVSLYPLFDHNSCFKGKSTRGIYFPSHKNFSNTLNYLKTLSTYSIIDVELIKSNLMSDSLREIFMMYSSLEIYNAMIERAKDL